MINLRKITLFLVISFCLSWGVFGLVFLRGGELQLEALGLVVAASMFAPAAAALIVKRFVYGESVSSYGFGFRKYEYLIIAWLLPVVLSLAAAFITVALGLAGFDPEMKDFIGLFPEGIRQAGVPPYYVVFLFSLFLPVVVNSLFTIGEELGWRGFLQDELKPLGRKRSYLLIGMIWGIWHAPIILLGHNYPGYPALGVIWMLIFSIELSFIFGWLKDASGSMWAPIIAHASLNGPGMVPLMFLSGLNTLLGSLLGVVGFVLMGLFIWWLMASKNIT